MRISVSVLLCLFLSSCDLIDYHPYDCRVTGETNINARNIEKIESACAAKDTIRFAVISDTQRWYDETHDLVKAINKRGDIDFVIHCGDQTDFGLTKEFLWMRDIFSDFQMPYVCIIGNHDCLGTGENVYHKVYGIENFSFNAGFLHVACLNTNAFEYDYSVAIPDFGFLKSDFNSLPSQIRTTVVAMHAAPNTEQFNNNVSEPFEAALNRYPDLRFCIVGHGHHNEVLHPFNDGLTFYECGSAKNHSFIVFTVTKDSTYYETHYDN